MDCGSATRAVGVLCVATVLLAGCITGSGTPFTEDAQEDEPEPVEVHVARFTDCRGVDLEFPEGYSHVGGGPFTPVPSVFGVLYSWFVPIFDCQGLSLGDEQEGAAGAFLGIAEVEPVAGATLEEVDAYYWFDFASTGSDALTTWLQLTGAYVEGFNPEIRFSDLAVFPDAQAEVTIREGGQKIGGAESLALSSPQNDPATVWGLYGYDWDSETLRLHVLRFAEHEVTTDGVGRVDPGMTLTTVLTSHRQGFDLGIELDVIEPVSMPSQE